MYAYDLADKHRGDFLLFYADQSVGQAREMLSACDPLPPKVICARPGPEDWQYFLLDTSEVAKHLPVIATGKTLENALGELMTQPAICLRGSDPVPMWAVSFAVIEDGRVVSFYDGAQPPPGWMPSFSVETIYSPTSRDVWMTAKGTEGAEDNSERYLQTEFPESLVIGEEGDLSVWVTSFADEGENMPLNLPSGAALDVMVRTEMGLKLTGANRGRITIPAGDEDSPRLVIKLRAENAGQGRLRVYCWHNGVSLGSIPLTVTIYADEDAARLAQKRSRSTELAPTSTAPAPSLTLWMMEERIEGKLAVRYLLNDAASTGEPQEFGPQLINYEPEAYFTHYLAEIEMMLRGASPDTIEDARTDLEMRGSVLFDNLFPPELKTILAQRQSEIQSIHILSQESWIPWELVYLYGSNSGTAGHFFGEFTLTRWNPDFNRQPVVKLNRLAIISPTGTDRMHMEEEVNALCQAAAAHAKIEVTRIPAQLSKLVSALDNGDFTCLHFAGHGRHIDEGALRSSILLEGGYRLYAQQFGGRMRQCGKTHPLVFFNACQTAHGETRLSGLDGWAHQFMEIGAAAFVGTHWSVSDQGSSAFAQAFYTNLLNGDAVGEAMRKARLEIQRLPTFDWLAYTVFCDPTARMA